jgi:ATP-dependent DNA ligase
MIEPMLAHKYNEKRLKKFSGDLFIQPKLDGIRATSYCPFGEERVSMLSRQANDLGCYVPHIVKQIKGSFQEDVTLDGELYLHGHPFQDLMHIIKGESELTKKIEYHVYDIFFHESPEENFHIRHDLLSDLHKWCKRSWPNIVLVKTFRVSGERGVLNQEITDHHALFKQGGYEGIMLRDGDSRYEPGKRSNGLLKYKDYEENDFVIAAVTPGEGKNAECATLVCLVGKQVFACTSPGTYEQKKMFLRRKKELIGKKVTVKYLALTKDGIPREPVALKINEIE